MKARLESTIYKGHEATSRDLRELLGLRRNGKLPKEAMAERLIQGVRVYVKPQDPLRSYGRPHRVYAVCNCGVHVPAGRLHQHKCRKGEK